MNVAQIFLERFTANSKLILIGIRQPGFGSILVEAHRDYILANPEEELRKGDELFLTGIKLIKESYCCKDFANHKEDLRQAMSILPIAINNCPFCGTKFGEKI